MDWLKAWPNSRAAASVAPPGGNCNTMRIGRFGYGACACTRGAAKAKASRHVKARSKDVMVPFQGLAARRVRT